jgi:CubicO group peptidase (beta-lactamase class C family)
MARLRVTAIFSLGVTLAVVGVARAADERFAAIVPAMQAYVDRGEAAGIVTLVASKDKVLHLEAVGTSDGTRPLEKTDLFWIASMSKPMTAVAAAMLVDDGKLKLDDPVEKYVPEFANLKFDGRAVRPITVRDLLNHTSGLSYNYETTQPHWTLRQFVQQIAKQPLAFAPGTQYSYSNAGIDVVGYIVQVAGGASGMPFDQFMQKRLFDALGMKDTTFWVAPGDMKRYARAFARDAATGKLRETPVMGVYGTEVTDKGRPPLGAAGIFSTAEDLAKFYQLILNKGKAGEKVLLKPETAVALVENQIGEFSAGVGLNWGYGFARIADPSALPSNTMLSPGTFGHMGLFGTNSWADPKREVVYVILMERGDIDNYFDSPMRTDFQRLAVKGLETPATK